MIKGYSKSNEIIKEDYYTDKEHPGQFMMNLRLTDEQRDLTMMSNPSNKMTFVIERKLLFQHVLYLYEQLLTDLV